jgi:hypothetical protein
MLEPSSFRGDFVTIEDRIALDKVALKAPQTAP